MRRFWTTFGVLFVMLFGGSIRWSPSLAANQQSQLGKEPVVFVHGFLGLGVPADCSIEDRTRQTEADVANYFEEADDFFLAQGDFAVYYAHLVSNPCFTPPLAENVPYLRAAIDQAKLETGQSQVILIAHSMGGLVSRAYIEGPAYAGDVKSVFIFGSPHQGIPLDVMTFLFDGLSMGALCQDFQPAACDFTVAGMQAFNLDYLPNPTVQYHLISGDAPFLTRNVLGWITAALIEGPDDGIVPTASGIGLGDDLDRLVTDENHNIFGTPWLSWNYFGPRTSFPNPTTPSRSYTECLKPVLIDATQADCRLAVQPPPQPEINFPGRTPIALGTLLPGQTTVITASFEGGPALFASAWVTGTLDLTLIDPFGQTIDPAYASGHTSEVAYAADEGYAAYFFPNALPGVWQIALGAGAVPGSGSKYALLAAFETQVRLQAGTDRLWYTPGTTATLTATVSGANLVTARIERADGVVDRVVLSPAGAGEYQATYLVPSSPGYAEIHFTASGSLLGSLPGSLPGGIPFVRASSQVFQISPNSIQLSSQYSENVVPRAQQAVNENEALEIRVGVEVVQAGKYGLSADLVSAQNGEFVAHGLAIATLPAGAGNLVLRFDASSIFRSQHDGPYLLTNLTLTDRSSQVMVIAQADQVYSTAPYSHLSFRTAAIFLPLVSFRR